MEQRTWDMVEGDEEEEEEEEEGVARGRDGKSACRQRRVF